MESEYKCLDIILYSTQRWTEKSAVACYVLSFPLGMKETNFQTASSSATQTQNFEKNHHKILQTDHTSWMDMNCMGKKKTERFFPSSLYVLERWWTIVMATSAQKCQIWQIIETGGWRKSDLEKQTLSPLSPRYAMADKKSVLTQIPTQA